MKHRCVGFLHTDHDVPVVLRAAADRRGSDRGETDWKQLPVGYR